MELHSVRVIFVGSTSFFTRAPLRAVADRCNVVGVVESPREDSAQRRQSGLAGRSLMRQYARHRRIAYLEAATTTPQLVDFIASLQADLICVSSSSLILRAEAFTLPRWGAINLHPSLLPAYRGPNPFFWQYHEMDLQGGVTVHRIDEGIDTGDILLQERFDIPLGAPFVDTFEKSLRIGTAALVRAVEQLAGGEAAPTPQASLPCPLYARFIRPDERFIDWDNWPIERIWHFLRGTHHEHSSLPAMPGQSWLVGDLEPAGCPERAGTICRDGAGDYLAHRDGKIRLRHRRAHRWGGYFLPRARRMRRIVEWW